VAPVGPVDRLWPAGRTPYPPRMDSTDGDELRWSHRSAAGHGWIRADLTRGTIAWHPDGELSAGSPGALVEGLRSVIRSLVGASR